MIRPPPTSAPLSLPAALPISTTLAALGRQRRRWSHGLAQLLWKHRRMIGNPRFGPVGLLALPFFLLFELLGPVVEVVGLVSVVLAASLGLLDTGTALVMFGLALGLGTLLSTGAGEDGRSQERPVGK